MNFLSRLIICLFVFSGQVSAQEMMENGDFEFINTGYSSTGYAIEFATPWESIVGTVDMYHNSTPWFSGLPSPNGGQGHMRLGHLTEYAKGKTMMLTAGQVYEISFYVKRQFSSPGYIRDIGMQIYDSDPIIGGFNPTIDFNPQFQITVTSGSNYVYASFCYTATTTGVHYVVIGGKGDPIPPDDTPYFAYYVDDVSVFQKNDITDMPSAQIVPAQSLFCIDDNIILDGGSSINETSYQWRICQVLPISGLVEIYAGSFISGQASTFDVNAAFASVNHNPNSNNCYRVILYTQNGCLVSDYWDFCYVNPNFNFITYDNPPICEGQLVNLSVTGDNGWIYDWEQGGVSIGGGTGVKTLSVVPTINNATFTVTVTTPEGCTSSKTFSFIVHSQNNLAPWMDGINGSGDYTIYVNQGNTVNFTSTLFNDYTNENITIIPSNNIPYNFTYNLPSSSGGTMSFSWDTSLNTPTDEYYFTLNTNDNNACNAGISSHTFTIIVICDHCPLCIYYENRGPGSTGIDLPIETKAGKCIEAGFSQTVNTGTDNVLFQAGKYIALGSSFSAGPGYQGVIEPTTCVTDCEDCCDDWTGFTYDPIQNYMNFDDGNPATSMWQLTDIEYPFCAFGAKGFDLEITNQWGVPLHSSSHSTTDCCPFVSPAPQNPINNSSIWWDGYTTNFFGNQVRPINGTYFYIITLYGCNGATVVIQDFITILGTSGIATAPSEPTQMTEDQKLDYELAQAEIEEMNTLKEQITLSPNPATETIQINGIDRYDNVSLNILDARGQIIKVISEFNGKIDVSELAKGAYYTHIYVKSHYITKKFVKQ